MSESGSNAGVPVDISAASADVPATEAVVSAELKVQDVKGQGQAEVEGQGQAEVQGQPESQGHPEAQGHAEGQRKAAVEGEGQAEPGISDDSNAHIASPSVAADTMTTNTSLEASSRAEAAGNDEVKKEEEESGKASRKGSAKSGKIERKKKKSADSSGKKSVDSSGKKSAKGGKKSADKERRSSDKEGESSDQGGKSSDKEGKSSDKEGKSSDKEGKSSDKEGKPSEKGKSSPTPSGKSEKSLKKAKEDAKSKDGTKSKPSSAKSEKKSKDGGSKASSKAGSKGGESKTENTTDPSKKGKKQKKKKQVEIDTGLPEGAHPLFLSSNTQELFNLRVDADVTVNDLYKNVNKSEILDDLHNRAAISDFHPFKQQILDYPGDEILVVYDPDFKHGLNFYIALTEQAKQSIIEMLTFEEGEEDDDDMEEDREEYRTIHYTGPTARPWQSLGSEHDIIPDVETEQHKFLITSAVRVRRQFGAQTHFSDRNSSDVKDGYVECPPYVDQNFDLNRIELDKAVQAVPSLTDRYIQTDWKYPRNAAVQYEPRVLSEKAINEIELTDDYKQFIITAVTRVELALQQNNIMDVFIDDWAGLAAEDNELGNKADNHLKEFQSFTDLQVSKDRLVSSVDWHPSINGVVGVSLAERMTFDERIDARHKISMRPSVILVWSFTDPIHPQLILEAPDDILMFKFCPTDPNIVAGGCVNGQVVLWDITEYSERLRLARSGKFKETAKTLPGFEDERSGSQPVIRYAAVSSIENSHRAAIYDLQWVPEHFEINRNGVPTENKTGQCCQLISCSTDQTILWWDIRPPTNLPKPDHNKASNPFGVPATFKHLDLTWKPLLKVNLFKSEQGGDHAPTRFSIAEHHKTTKGGSSKHIRRADGDAETNQSTNNSNNPGTAKVASSISTRFYAGTEDGEVVYLDWVPKKDADSGKFMTARPDFYHALHDGPIVTLQRSPFFSDVVLAVGGWSFSLWKEGVAAGPILRSPMSSKRLTGGYWSPSRPAVFYICRQDGGIDIWDLLDRTHEPCITQSISSSAITCLAPVQLSSKQHLLAVCDDRGTLHVLTIPWSLRQPTPNERQSVQNYVDREVKRREFVAERWKFREKEKTQLDIELKKKAGIVVQAVATDDELESRMKREYDQYLVDEQSFLRQLEQNAEGDGTSNQR